MFTRTAHSTWTARWLGIACTAWLASCADAPEIDDVAFDEAEAIAQTALAHAPLAIPTRGAAPEGYLATPHGFFHPSCVIEIGSDEKQAPDGSIQRASGAIRSVAPCKFAHFDRSGRAIAPDGSSATAPGPAPSAAVAPGAAIDDPVPPPTFSGWLMASSNNSNGAIQRVQATWNVPPEPAIEGNQVVYYFPGIEDISNVQTIVQPVLGWFGGSWTIASWNCCKDGNVTHSNLVGVNPGDQIFGFAAGSGCDGNGHCPNWQISTQDQTTGASTTLNSSSFGQIFDWTFGGVLEVYDIDHCAQFPTSGSATFRNIGVTRVGGAAANIAWPSGSSNASPGCGYRFDASGTSITISSTATTQAKPASPTGCGQLTAGQGLIPGQQVNSCDGRFQLKMQLDGNLVLYQGATALWATGTFGSTGFSAVLQPDGNFVLYNMTGTALFASRTNGRTGNRLAIQNDGNLVVYSSTGQALWASNTCCR